MLIGCSRVPARRPEAESGAEAVRRRLEYRSGRGLGTELVAFGPGEDLVCGSDPT